MKNFIFGMMASLVFTLPDVCLAEVMPTEVSALLLREECQNILTKKKQQAQQSGQTLHLTGYQVVDVPPNRFVYLFLGQSLSADLTHQVNASGTIVGSVQVGPLGEVGFDGIYFKPAETLGH